MKKSRSLGLLIGIILMGSVCYAQDRHGDQGIGLMAGSPTGVNWKYWIDNKFAFDVAAGVARSEFNVHASILYHEFDWLSRAAKKSTFFSDIKSNGELPFYFGVGPKLLFRDKEEFGIRFPVGVSFIPNDSPWDFFGEFAPILRVTPSSGINADFSIGFRYHFPAIRPQVGE
ncbi:MAG: hypothetical protein ACKVQC_02780 [Elusimicrobiota bacterium]